MTLHQREATVDDLPAIGRIAAAAFHPSTDAISCRLFPPHLESPNELDHDGARAWRQARKTANFHDERTVTTVVVDDDLNGQVVGFCLWEAPVPRGSPDDQEEAHPADPEAPPTLDREAFQEMRTVVHGDVEARFGKRGTKDVWHLDYLGVDPQHQRRGIGKMLLQWGLDLAQKDNRDCYLVATPAGRPLYLNAGFENLGTVEIFGVPHYSMILQASTSRV